MNRLMLLKRTTVGHGYRNPDGIEHVDAWQDVRRRVGCIEPLYHIYKHVIPFKYDRTEIQAIWEHRAYDEENGHPCKQKRGELVKSLPVGKEEITDGKCDKEEPEQIGHYKVFHKWNVVVQRRMYQVKMTVDMLFQIDEPWHIDEYI